MLTTPLEPVEKRPVRHQNNFHFIRFAAALLVLFGHSYSLTSRPDWMSEVTLGLFPSASMGVCIFFVVSGYLITQSLETSPTTANFVWKRVLRIYPGLIVSLLVTVFLIGPLATTLPLTHYFSSAQTYYYLTLIRLIPPYSFELPLVYNELPGVFQTNPEHLVNGSLWTLCYEVAFYGALLLAARLGGFAHRPWLLLGTVLGWGLMLLIGAQLYGTNRIVPVLNLRPFDVVNQGLFFAAGMLARLYRKQLPYSGRYALLAVAVWLGTYWLTRCFPALPLTIIRWVRYPALSYLVLYLSFLKGPVNRFGDRGDVSYGLYIYGFPVQQLLIQWLGMSVNAPLLIGLSVVATLPFAIASWVWVEKPALRWKTQQTHKLVL